MKNGSYRSRMAINFLLVFRSLSPSFSLFTANEGIERKKKEKEEEEDERLSQGGLGTD